MTIIYTSKFAREYKKLPLEIKKEAEKIEEIFRKNPLRNCPKSPSRHKK